MKVRHIKRDEGLLQYALRKWRKNGKPIPSEGYMINLHYVSLDKKEWHYQVDMVNDHRFYKWPQINVYGFAPPPNFSARSADTVYTVHVNPKTKRMYRKLPKWVK